MLIRVRRIPTSNRLHFSTTFRLGCGGGLILAGEGVFDEISTTEGFPGSPGLVYWGQPDGLHPLLPHQIAATPRSDLAKFGSGSVLAPPESVRRRIWGVAQPAPSCLALRRCWSSSWVCLRLPSGRYRDRGSLALAASPTCVLSSLGPASGPKLSWISLDMA